MDKKEFRASAIMKLKNLSEHEKQTIERKLTNQLINSDLWKHAKIIGITMAQGFEWDTKAIIDAAWKQGKIVCIPKCYPKEKELVFYQFESYDELEVVYYHLLEPKPEAPKEINKARIDLLIVPGIVFDVLGYRIGFGGGYYDRFLMDYPNKTISLVSTIQIVDHIPAESFDIPVQYLITEEKIIQGD